MPAGRFSRNTVLAGLFVLVMVGLLVFGVVLIAGGGDMFGFGKTQYVVEFKLEDGAEGLDKGSKVKLGGRRIGSVKSIEFNPKPSEGKPITGLLVTIEVDSNLKLYKNADVSLARPLLGSNSSLNFLNLKGEGDAAVVAPGGRITGKLGPPGFLSQADYAKVQSLLARVDHWTGDIDRDWDTQYKKILTTIDDTHVSVANVREITTKANSSWSTWSKQIDDVLGDLGPRFKKIADEAQAGVEKARATVDRVYKIIEDNQPLINDAVKDARELIGKANGPAYNDVMEILKRGKDVMASVTTSVREAESLVATQSPKLSAIVDQALVASTELKLTTAEIRAAPWRLFYQPNKKELENEALYNTMRAYSRSLADVRAATDSLRAASQSVAATPAGVQPAIRTETLDEITAKLREALSETQEQEKKLLDLWKRQNPDQKH